jgi:hypothetical protein
MSTAHQSFSVSRRSVLFLLLLRSSSNAFKVSFTNENARVTSSLKSSDVSPEQKIVDEAAREELESFATECNPSIAYFDPLRLAEKEVRVSRKAKLFVTASGCLC